MPLDQHPQCMTGSRLRAWSRLRMWQTLEGENTAQPDAARMVHPDRGEGFRSADPSVGGEMCPGVDDLLHVAWRRAEVGLETLKLRIRLPGEHICAGPILRLGIVQGSCRSLLGLLVLALARCWSIHEVDRVISIPRCLFVWSLLCHVRHIRLRERPPPVRSVGGLMQHGIACGIIGQRLGCGSELKSPAPSRFSATSQRSSKAVHGRLVGRTDGRNR